jgi:hypothetical protein
LEEVDQAIKEIPTGKSSGPNGFKTNFFHNCWHIVQEEFWHFIEYSHRSREVFPALNTTFITLIPKEEQVTQPKQFHPIVLSNVIYKILTKVISLRLKPCLPFIIYHEQSGYVEGKKILDTIILAHEVIHSPKILTNSIGNICSPSSLFLGYVKNGSTGS